MTRRFAIAAWAGGVVSAVTTFAAWNPFHLVDLAPLGTGYPVVPVAVILMLVIVGGGFSSLRRPVGILLSGLLVSLSLLLLLGYGAYRWIAVMDHQTTRVVDRATSPDGRWELVTFYHRAELRELGQTYRVMLRTRDGLFSREALVFFGDGDGEQIGPVTARFTGRDGIDVVTRRATFHSTYARHLPSVAVHPAHRILVPFSGP
jgi:hypothetical protein